MNYELCGKCKEKSEELCKQDSSLTLVRGHYFCPFWGKRAHWWCKNSEGKIIDPTKEQFPSQGMGWYEEFNGEFECEQCGKKVLEAEAYGDERHVFCSNLCYGRCVGVL